MNLKSVEYFLILAEELNFTRAAERVYISQQALSSLIRRMEEEYHVRFFERKPLLRLTPAGEAMVFYGRQLLEKEDALLAALAAVSKECRATLRVGFSRLRSEAHFPEIWNAFHPGHGNISLELIDGRSQTFEKLLQARKILMYIGVDVADSLHHTKHYLTTEKVQCCFSLTLLKRYFPHSWETLFRQFQAGGVDLNILRDVPLILQRPENRLRQSLDEYFSRSSKPDTLVECDQQSLIFQLAKQGDGIGLISPTVSFMYRGEINIPGNDIWVAPVANDIHENTVSLVHLNDFPLPDYAVDFAETVKETFRKHP